MPGYGQLFGRMFGYGGESPEAPRPSRVGNQYQRLLNAYISSAPSIYQEEAQYQPLYTQLGLQNRGAVLDWTRGQAPGVMETMRGYNPQATSLLDELGVQASDQLAQNGGLDPAMQRRLTQNVRSSQAARGLGYGPGDAAQENYYLTNTMEQRRAANQQFAANVGQLQEQYYKDPFSVVAGVGATAPGVTPSIIGPQQSDAMMGTIYNAQAAANIAAANNRTASDNAY